MNAHAGWLLRKALLLGLVFSTLCSPASADYLQNKWVRGSLLDLCNAGFCLTGNGIGIGVIEAGGGIPNRWEGIGSNVAPGSMLPDGNIDLPTASITFLPQAGQVRRSNHASAVTGVIISNNAVHKGIAPDAHIWAGGITNQDLAEKMIQAALQQRSTPIVNMSWGGYLGPGNNNGNMPPSPFVDWAAGRYDALLVVAGNETPDQNCNVVNCNTFGTPSDAFNTINVGATGVRAAAADPLDYRKHSPYNRTNETADVSPVTGYGRRKTDIVAPGGDPGPPGALKSFNTVVAADFVHHFHSTAGGQVEYAGSTGMPPNVVQLWMGDTLTGSTTMNDPFLAGDTHAPFVVGTNNNPGGNLGGNDALIPTTIAGTSFAAPLVSGAAALVYEYFVGTPPLQGWSADHRLIKAVILNGGRKRWADGTVLRDRNNIQWLRAAGAGTKSTPAAFPGAFAPRVRPGLDIELGTGQMDVIHTLLNYAAGRQSPGIVNDVGWDMNTAGSGLAANSIVNTYEFITPGISDGWFQATLCWDRSVTINNPGQDETWTQNSTFTTAVLPDLDLYLFAVNPDGSLGVNIDYSTSDIDNVEHLYVPNLPGGKYRLVVTNVGALGADVRYGLAWRITSVPEPTALCMFAIGVVVTTTIRRHRVPWN